jgi:hypothetical protein
MHICKKLTFLKKIRRQRLHSSGILRASGRRRGSAAPVDTAAVSATPADTASEDGPLTSSLPSRGQSSIKLLEEYLSEFLQQQSHNRVELLDSKCIKLLD